MRFDKSRKSLLHCDLATRGQAAGQHFMKPSLAKLKKQRDKAWTRYVLNQTSRNYRNYVTAKNAVLAFYETK